MKKNELDHIDIQILNLLQVDARIWRQRYFYQHPLYQQELMHLSGAVLLQASMRR